MHTQVSTTFANRSTVVADVRRATRSFGTTFTASAILDSVAFFEAQSTQATRILLIFTDGAVSIPNRGLILNATAAMSNSNIVPIIVGIGAPDFNRAEFETLALGRPENVLLFEFDVIADMIAQAIQRAEAECPDDAIPLCRPELP